MVRHASATAVLLAATATLLATSGCHKTERIVEAGESGARNILGRADPTGVVEMNQSIKDAATSVRERVNEVDVAALQACIAELGELIDSVRIRIDALAPNDIETLSLELTASLGAVRAQLDRVRLSDAIDSIIALTRQIEAEINTLDLEALNGLLAEARDTMAVIQGRVEPIVTSLNATIETARTQIDEVGRKADSLPFADIAAAGADIRKAAASIREVAEGLPRVEGELHRVLATARTTLWITAGAVTMAGLGALLRLTRMLRRSGEVASR
jgi:hypothetical protein